MAYLIVQMILYLLGAFALGLILGWVLWGRLAGTLNKSKAEQEPLRAEIERLKTSLEACGRAYADLEKKHAAPASAGTSVTTQPEVLELEPANLLEPHAEARPAELKPAIVKAEPADIIDAEVIVPPPPKPTKSKRKAAQPEKIDPVMEAEDLSRIVGIGPENAKRLNASHVSTFAQIANWNDDDIERIEDILGFHGRIGRERWIEQAKLLAAGDEEEFARLFPTANTSANS